MQFGYKRCKNYLKHYLKQTKKTERKARFNLVGSTNSQIQPNTRTAQCARCLYVPLGRVIPDNFSDKINDLAMKKKKKKTRGIGTSHASFWYLTNGAQLLFSSAVRFWFQIIFEVLVASFVPGLSVAGQQRTLSHRVTLPRRRGSLEGLQ